jgi:hypothetical protein
MALPASDTKAEWPPKNMQHIFAYMRQWSAWYSNDIAKLQEAYGGGASADSTGFFASDTGGYKPTIGQRIQRFFVAQRPMGPNRNTKLPMPVAGMICQAMADLLYAEPPTFTVASGNALDMPDAPDATTGNTPSANPTQARLNELADAGMYSVLAQATELAAALSGSFVRVAWDKQVVDDRPFLDVVDADMALPEFRWGRLVAVTFWEVVARDEQTVWRHLERHELSGITGNGIILHGLYKGEDDKLGVRVQLTDRPETAPLAAMTAGSTIKDGVDSLTPGLCVEYLPHPGPNRLWRDDLIGRNLGRSSLDGIEHLMDQLAETLSDWMRARRAAKARVWFDKSLLGNPGPGAGMVADLDQEVFIGTEETVKGPNTTMADKIQIVQPKFDPIGYEKTAQMLLDDILQLSGFTLQTFGMNTTASRGVETTATEVEARERRTFMTRDRLIRAQMPHLASVLRKLLAVDRAIFNTPNEDSPITVAFPDGVQESMLKLGQTVLTLFTAESASVEERVRILHPDWNDDQWQAEVDRLNKEKAAAQAVVADPGGDGGQLKDELPPGVDPTGAPARKY